jgi:hypothetical protein
VITTKDNMLIPEDPIDPFFQLKDGTLNAYALACGYVQKSGNGWELTSANPSYFVRRSYEEWLVFDSLTQARKEFRRLAKLGN